MERWKSNLIAAAITLVIATGIMFGVIGGRGIFAGDLQRIDVMRYLSDGFLIAGGVVFCLGLLVWAGSKGAYDGLSYGVSNIINMRWTNNRMDWHKKESFADYRERKKEKRKQTVWIPILIVGAVFMIVSFAFLGVYYSIA